MENKNNEEKLIQEINFNINSLKSLRALIDFQLLTLENKLTDIINEQDSRIFVKNNSKGVLFIGDVKLSDFKPKKDFKSVDPYTLKSFYDSNLIEDISGEDLNNIKKMKQESVKKLKPICGHGSISEEEIDSIIIDNGTTLERRKMVQNPLAESFEIKGVTDIEERYINKFDFNNEDPLPKNIDQLVYDLENGKINRVSKIEKNEAETLVDRLNKNVEKNTSPKNGIDSKKTTNTSTDKKTTKNNTSTKKNTTKNIIKKTPRKSPKKGSANKKT